MKGQKIHTVCFHHYIYICPNQTVLPFKNQISKSRDARGLIHSHLARLQKGIYYMTKPHQSLTCEMGQRGGTWGAWFSTSMVEGWIVKGKEMEEASTEGVLYGMLRDSNFI